MRFRTMMAIFVAGLLAAFVAVNWRVFAAPASLSFLVTSTVVPIGVVMAAMLALGLLAVSSFLGAWHGTLLAELRRQSKELLVQRSLAENAESSRFTELGTLIRSEIAALRQELKDTESSIAATLGEMDDRYRRGPD
jgi:hypothetical protein